MMCFRVMDNSVGRYENITWNKVKTTVKDWQVGDYIRQTSIVVIGVLITFVGSELVTQNSEKKDIQATMSLIRDELKSNREIIRVSFQSLERMNVFPAYWWSMT